MPATGTAVPDRPLRWRPVAAAVAIYFAVLLAAIGATLVFDIALVAYAGLLALPTAWALVLGGLYYAAPALAALAAGARTRPFWRHAGATLGAIALTHGAYGASLGALRSAYLAEWSEDLAATRGAAWRVPSFDYAFADQNGDGLVDRVRFAARLDPGTLPAGDYVLSLGLAAAGTELPRIRINQDVGLAGPDEPARDLAFEADPRRFADLVGTGDIEARVTLTRWKRVDRRGRALAALCRWAAAFCPTAMSGGDAAIQDVAVELEPVAARLTFAYPAGRVQRDQVVFRRFLGDHGRDRDGDGRFDELVVAMELDSTYEGPVYVQASLGGTGRFLPTFQGRLGTGLVRFEYVIAGAELAAAGLDGPYTLESFAMINNDPYCPAMRCKFENLPLFSVYLGAYTTGPYRAGQFE